MSNRHTLELDDATFSDHIARGDRPTLVDFWAPWYPPRRALAPSIEALAERYEGQAVVAKLDVDRSPETAAARGIASIPTVLVIRGGREVDRIVGLQPRSRYERAPEQAAVAQ